MKTYFTIFISIFLINTLFSQEEYPLKIQKGETKKVVAEQQALWILKESQFDKAMKDSKEQRNLANQVELLEAKISLLQQKETEKDSLVSNLITDRDYYKKTWEETSKDITELAKQTKAEIRKKKFYRFTTVVGIPAAFILGFIIAL